MRPGAVVGGRFRLLSPLGQGGMASIWAALDTKLNSDVAVKFLDSDLASSPEAAERFQRETLAVSRIASIHVVRVIDYDVTEHQEPYIIFERLHGYDLDALLAREKRLSVKTVTSVVLQACRALASAHDAGVIHRDIKPANIFLTEDGPELFVHVLDFGVAKMVAARDSRKLTRPDELLGTLEYMSPEQVLRVAETIDCRADIYALGVVAYRAATGEVPFMGDALGELLLSLTQKPLRPASSLRPELSPAWDAWFAKALSIDPGGRFATAKEMADSLRQIQEELTAAPGPSDLPFASVKVESPAIVVPPPAGSSATAGAKESLSPPVACAAPSAKTTPPTDARPGVVKESVKDACGKHRSRVEKAIDRASYELEAWTPAFLRNRTQPVHRVLGSSLRATSKRIGWERHDSLLIVAALVGALSFVVLGLWILG